MVAEKDMQKSLMVGNDNFLFGTEGNNYEQDLSSADEEGSAGSCFSSSTEASSYEEGHQRPFQQQYSSQQLHFRSETPPQSCRFEGGTLNFLPASFHSHSSLGTQFPVRTTELDNQGKFHNNNTIDPRKMQQNSFCSNNNSNNNNENNIYTMCTSSSFPLRTCVNNNSNSNNNKQPKKKRSTKTVYIPHKDKPAPVVDKRNARERRRVEAVNDAFKRLRKIIPYENRNKRLSKFKTLKIAINYIHNLKDILREEEEQGTTISECSPAHAQWSCDPRQEVLPHHVMQHEHKYSGSHDFTGFEGTVPMMHHHQYSNSQGPIYGQYQNSHPGYSPVAMDTNSNSNVAMEMSSSCHRWTGPQVQISPHNAVYQQHS